MRILCLAVALSLDWLHSFIPVLEGFTICLMYVPCVHMRMFEIFVIWNNVSVCLLHRFIFSSVFVSCCNSVFVEKGHDRSYRKLEWIVPVSVVHLYVKYMYPRKWMVFNTIIKRLLYCIEWYWIFDVSYVIS
jgi:hypothetical protein